MLYAVPRIGRSNAHGTLADGARAELISRNTSRTRDIPHRYNKVTRLSPPAVTPRFLLSFAAGNFIYVAASDLIPRFHVRPFA
jgi:hypothetical protein